MTSMEPPLVHQFITATSVSVCVRPVKPGDTAHLLHLFASLSADSRYQRFAKVLEHADAAHIEQEARAMATMPAEQGAAWIAFALLRGQAPEPAGVVRYLLIGPDTAEVDIAVADAYQRCGIGTQLSLLLVEQARAAGLRRLTWVVQQSNHAMICMLVRAPFPVRRHAAGDLIIVEADLELAARAPA
jgi:GNAT superfamily N-acetyltransferase